MRAHHDMDVLHFLSCFSRLLYSFDILFLSASCVKANAMCKILQLFYLVNMPDGIASYLLTYMSLSLPYWCVYLHS